MQALRIPNLSEEDHQALMEMYRTTALPRMRTRAQMMLLSFEQGLKAPQIAHIGSRSGKPGRSTLNGLPQIGFSCQLYCFPNCLVGNHPMATGVCLPHRSGRMDVCFSRCAGGRDCPADSKLPECESSPDESYQKFTE